MMCVRIVCWWQVRNVEWENEVLQQRFAKVQSERDELYDKFEASIYQVQQKTGTRLDG
jgi:growth arrest-specific protein 8